MGAALDLGRKLGIVHRRKLGGARRIEHADQARTPAGQGNQRERAALGMEFGRCVVVRPGVGEIERQRRLRIAPPPRGDAGGGAAERARPSAPTTSRTRASPSACSIVTPSASRFDRERRRGNARQFQFGGARFERRQQMAVLDIVAERLEPDFGGVEKNFRRAKEPPGVVDDAKIFAAARRAAGRLAKRRAFPAP